MKQYIKLFIILFLIIWSVWWINSLYAKDNSSNKKIILSEKYDSKKVDKIKSTIKQKNNYRFWANSKKSVLKIYKFLL